MESSCVYTYIFLFPLNYFDPNKFQKVNNSFSMNIAIRLLLCKKCKRTNRRNAATPHVSGVSSYYLCVRCAFCDEVWYICSFHNRRWNVRNQYGASNHFNDITIRHPSDKDATDNRTTNENDDEDNGINMFTEEGNDTDANNYQQSNVFSTNHKFIHMSSNSQRYFSLLEEEPNVLPAQYLVHSAFNENTVLSSQFSNMFETEFHMHATRLCLSISNLQHIELITLLSMLESCIDYSNNKDKFVTTRVPTSLSEVNSFYLNKSTSI